MIKKKQDLCAVRQTDRQRQMGVFLQMCIPAARGVMESLNEAQQECKQNRAKDEAWGCLRVGREQRTALFNSLQLSVLLVCTVSRSAILLLELESSRKNQG